MTLRLARVLGTDTLAAFLFVALVVIVDPPAWVIIAGFWALLVVYGVALSRAAALGDELWDHAKEDRR